MPEVFCNDVNCLWYQELKKKHIVNFCKDYKPLGEDDGYSGMCLRDEIAIEPREISGGIIMHKVTDCRTRSDKSLGHIDFTKIQPVSIPEKDMKHVKKAKKL